MPSKGPVDSVVEVEKVVGEVVVVSAGDRSELSEDDVDSPVPLLKDDSEQLVEVFMPVGIGNSGVGEFVVVGSTSEAEVVFAKGKSVLVSCEGEIVAMLERSSVLSPG